MVVFGGARIFNICVRQLPVNSSQKLLTGDFSAKIDSQSQRYTAGFSAYITFTPDASNTTMSSTKTEPTRAMRFVGAVVAFVIFVSALLALLFALEAASTAERTILFIGKAFAYAGFGALVIGWKLPQTVLHPFRRLLPASAGLSVSVDGFPSGPTRGGSAKLLTSSLERALFALSCLGLVPWLFMRLVPELWQSSDAADYMRQVFVRPLSPWFESGWWWYTQLEWYDWPVLPSLLGLSLAFGWSYTGARLIAWIRGTK